MAIETELNKMRAVAIQHLRGSMAKRWGWLGVFGVFVRARAHARVCVCACVCEANYMRAVAEQRVGGSMATRST